MIQEIDHIAFKVKSISDTRKAFEDLGLPCKKIERFPEVGMRIAFLGTGKTGIELLEVIDRNSPIANENTGINHLALKVENIQETYDKMNKSNLYTVAGQIRNGAHSRIFFFRINGLEEILFECVE